MNFIDKYMKENCNPKWQDQDELDAIRKALEVACDHEKKKNKKLLSHIKNWIETQQFHEESNCLDDLHFVSLQEFIQGICDIVGYYKSPEEEE